MGQLLEESKAAAAPFADALDSEISELLRLETCWRPPRACRAVIATSGRTTCCRQLQAGSV